MLFIIVNNPSLRNYIDNPSYRIYNDNLITPDVILSIHQAIMDIDVNIPTIITIITAKIDADNVLSESKFSQLTEYTDLHSCPICLEDNLENIILDCKHIFCKRCIKKWTTSNSKTCPLCRISIN
jgi:hypothetical protein